MPTCTGNTWQSHFALWVALALGFLALTGCDRESTRDVILVTLDTTRADHISAYGYSRDITPEIDTFARDAVVFDRAWSTACWTLPSHASMFTGKYPTSHGAHYNATSGALSLADAVDIPVLRDFKANKLGEDQVTLAELLLDEGYETAAFVGGPWLTPVFGALQGYDHQDAELPNLHGRKADEITDRVIAWLKNVPRERGIHLFVNYFDPHDPYEPPPGYDTLPLAKAPLLVTNRDVNRGGSLPPMQRAAYIDHYDGEILFMDHHFGRLLKALQETGRYDDALIIVVADHGETFGEHGLMGHAGWLYEEVLRVPLIVRYPGGRNSGSRTSDLVSVVDLLWLVSEITEIDLPEGAQSVPFGARQLVLAEAYRDAYAISHWGPRFNRDLVAAIRWPWKLILSDRGNTQFYRLDEDPKELVNLVGTEEELELRKALESARASLKPPETLSVPKDVSDETRERLRSLGYIE